MSNIHVCFVDIPVYQWFMNRTDIRSMFTDSSVMSSRLFAWPVTAWNTEVVILFLLTGLRLWKAVGSSHSTSDPGHFDLERKCNITF